MGIFGDKKPNKEAKTAPTFAKSEVGVPTSESVGKKKVEPKKKEKKEIIKNENIGVKNTSFFGHDVIVFPRVTEKSHNIAHLRQYAFNVKKTANKDLVRKAVEHIYNVKVEKVRIANVPAKKRRMGKVVGKKSGYKKAIVTLREGFNIEVTPQ
jgi:large subunit ribosomal protein L23